jgi:hypothetical protein
MNEPFDAPELMQLLHGVEERGIPYEIQHRRVTDDCDGIVVRMSTAARIWELGFYDNDHIEILRYVHSGNAETGVTAASVLAEWDAVSHERQ